MRKLLAAATAVVLLAGMTACQHRKTVVTAAPPPPPPPVHVKQAPAIPRATMADMPEIPSPSLPVVVLGGAVQPEPAQHEVERPPAQQPQETAKASGADAVSSANAGEEPPTTTPIGQLSAAPNTQGLPDRKKISNEIQWISQQLKKIHHALTTRQQRTESQIQTFLAKATNALQAGDLDGAHTLTVKARVLLGELQ